MTILDGKKVRDFHRQRLAERAARLSRPPRLAIVQVGDNRESGIYIEQKKKMAASVGASVDHIRLPASVSFDELASVVRSENGKAGTDGIIVQLPLPPRLDRDAVINLIDPKKDVDGLTDESQRLLAEGKPRFVPATAKAVGLILDFYGIDPKGKKVVVLGRSKLVGSPTAKLLALKGGDVAVCHSKTPNAAEIARSADILVVAIGKPELVGPDYVREGAVVIDVGINSVAGDKLESDIPRRKVVGDVDQKAVSGLATAMTPVPGGVGPVTVLCLFDTLMEAAERAATEG